METEIEFCFQKKFHFQGTNDRSCWSCANPFRNTSWKILELENLKYQLNSTKRLLSSMETQKWHKHTASTNRAGAIFHRIKDNINPELLTQAWLKFYECIHQFDLVGSTAKSSPVFQSVHLCEAPGAFVTSLNHYLKSNHPDIEFRWLATTLNPYYEGNSMKSMISDDRFIYHTLEHWSFGSDDTGNIMEWCNVEKILESNSFHDVHLVTADGSVDCADNPGEQENNLAKLHWCETITALSLLSRGGSYVLKVFTLFEHSTICLLYLLMLSFEELHAFKPCTSKEGNSEIYIISLRYTKTEEIGTLLRIIQQNIYERGKDVSSVPLFSQSEIPESFVSDIVHCANIFTKYQEEAILRNLTMYNIPSEKRDLDTIKRKTADRYVEKYCLKRIPRKFRIVGNKKLKSAFLETEIKHLRFISYSADFTVSRQQILDLQSEFEQIGSEIGEFPLLEWTNRDKQDWRHSISFVNGKPYDIVCNTKFCHSRTFRYFLSLGQTRELVASKSKSVFDTLYIEKQNDLLNRFLVKVSSISENENFVVESIPLLSRFSVATAWIISLLFSKVEIRDVEEPQLQFAEYKGNPEILDWMKSLDRSFLNFVNTSKLFNESFCDFISYYNTKCIIRALKNCLSL